MLLLKQKKRGMKATGHIPITVKVEEASQAGLDAVEHMPFMLIALSAKEDSITRLARKSFENAKPMSRRTALSVACDSYSKESASKIYRALARNHTAVVPTIIGGKTIGELKGQDHSHD